MYANKILQKFIWRYHFEARFKTRQVSRSPNEARKETPYSDRGRIIHKETELSTQRIDRRTRDSGKITGVVSGDRITCGTCGFNRT